MAEGEEILTNLADIQVGMRLEAMDKFGKWYIARVIEVDEDGGDVLVHFDGWSSRYDEYVEVKEGRLKTLTSTKLTALLKEKKTKKTLNIDDRVQAKWEDGKMYFGKVVSIRGGDVEVLFDDGVYYTAPFSHVRKRNMDKAQDVMEDYLREPPLAAAMEARKRRAEKRQRNDDSASQTSLSSPPSSPVFMPKKVKPCRIDDDSTETESDVEDGHHVRIRERPFSKQTQNVVATESIAVSSKGGSKSSSPASSDSEQSRRPSRKYEALREPYKLRGVTQLSTCRLSPVDEDPMAKSLTGSGSGLGSTFLTPPFESQTVVKPSQMLPLSSSPSQRPSLGSTPPETPELGSRSQRLRKSASALASGSSAEDTCASSHGKKPASDSDILVPINLGDSRGSSSEPLSSNLLEDKVGSYAREAETALGKRIESLLYCEENWEDFVQLFPKQKLDWSDSDYSSPSLADPSSFELEATRGVATTSTAVLSTHFSESQQPSESSCEQEVSFVASTSKSGSPSLSASSSSSRIPATGVLQLSGGRELAKTTLKRRGKQRSKHKVPSSLLNSERCAGMLSNAVAPSTNVEGPTECGMRRDQGAESSRRIVSDSATPTPSKRSYAGSPLAPKKQLSPSTSVATRTRAQTKFEHVAKKSEKKPAKLAPKELVIMWDHNEHKCKFTGCGKSFRKETLLLSHIKHYHHIKTKTPVAAKAKGAAGAAVKPGGKSQSPLSPKSPQMSPKTPIKSSPKLRSPKSRVPRSPKPRMLRSPKSPSLKSILSPPQPKGGSSARSDPLRRSKSPTESFFESIEKQHRSIEVMKLLEQSAKEQAAALSRKSPPVPLTSHPSSSLKKPGITVGPTALKLQLPESSITSSGKMTARAPEYASPRPTILQIQQSKPKSSASSSKPSSSGHKKMKQVVVRALSPLTFPLVEIKALPKDSLPLSPTKKLQSHAKASHSPAVQSQKGGGRTTSTSKEAGTSLLDDGADLVDEGEGGGAEDVRSPSMGSEGNEDDVVHCVCGSEVDEGFMIQCEQCLCWQHGDCIAITKETLPEKYICYICTNPPGLRTRLKHRFDRDWFAEGSLPSFPGGPKFPESAAIRMSHRLADSLFKLRKMVHSTKVKLQAASNPNHPYLKQWAKECTHLSKEDIMSYLIAALQPVSYESGDTQEASNTSSPVALRTEGGESSAEVKGTQEPQNVGISKNENSSREDADSNTNVPLGKRSSPINVAALYLDPLPSDSKSCSVTPTPPPPPSSSSPTYPSLTTTADSSSPKSLKLAPLPPLSVEDLRSLTDVNLNPPLQQSTPVVTPAAASQTSSSRISGATESVPTLTASASQETVHKPSISFSENPIPESEKTIPGSEDFFDSNLEISEEFGVQEMSVFAVDGDSHPTESKLPQILRNEQDVVTPPAVGSPSTRITTSTPFPTPSSNKLISSSRSAFKPVIVPITSSSAAKSPLTSLLASQQTTSSRGGLMYSQSASGSGLQPASVSVKPPTAFTESSASLGSLGLQPSIERNPIFTPTLSSLSSAQSTMDTVTLGEFAEAFMHGDMTNWVHRMLLYDHVEAVQNKVMAWMDLVEKQLEEIPCDESSLKDMNALLTDVQSIVRQLGQVQHIAASESS